MSEKRLTRLRSFRIIGRNMDLRGIEDDLVG